MPDSTSSKRRTSGWRLLGKGRSTQPAGWIRIHSIYSGGLHLIINKGAFFLALTRKRSRSPPTKKIGECIKSTSFIDGRVPTGQRFGFMHYTRKDSTSRVRAKLLENSEIISERRTNDDPILKDKEESVFFEDRGKAFWTIMQFGRSLEGKPVTSKWRGKISRDSYLIPVARPVTNGENSKINGFPVEPHFAQVVAKAEKRSGFSHSLLIVQVPLVYCIWPKKHRTGWSSYLLGTPWTKICFHYMGNIDLLK
ncbi:hypothetical protein HN51_043303 [Arachis hypogaea]